MGIWGLLQELWQAPVPHPQEGVRWGKVQPTQATWRGGLGFRPWPHRGMADVCKVNAQALRWMSKCWLSESPEAVLVKRTPPGGHKCQWSVTSEDGDATQRMAPVKLRTEAPERKWLSALGKTVRGPCHRPHRSWQPPVYKSKLPKDNAFQAEGNTLCSVCLTQPVLVLIPIWVDRPAWLTQQACLAISRQQVAVVHRPKESQAVCELSSERLAEWTECSRL